MTTEINEIEEGVIEGFKKKCTICGERKELDRFMTFRSKIDGKTLYQKRCRICVNKIYSVKRKLERHINPEPHKEANRRYHEKNKEKRNKSCKVRYFENKERYSKFRKESYAKNKEEINRKRQERTINDPIYREQLKKHHHDRKQKSDYKERKRKNRQKSLQNTAWRIRSNLGKYIAVTLKRAKTSKSLNTIALLGCTAKEFANYLQSQFTPEMNWENYGKYWEVDHIIPCCAFNLEDIEHQLVCFNYRNCRPLEALVNSTKAVQDKIYPKITDLESIKEQIFGVKSQ